MKKKKKPMSDVSKGYKKNTLLKENNNKISYVIEVKKKMLLGKKKHNDLFKSPYHVEFSGDR